MRYRGHIAFKKVPWPKCRRRGSASEPGEPETDEIVGSDHDNSASPSGSNASVECDEEELGITDEFLDSYELKVRTVGQLIEQFEPILKEEDENHWY
jgi:hypothetical protein